MSNKLKHVVERLKEENRRVAKGPAQRVAVPAMPPLRKLGTREEEQRRTQAINAGFRIKEIAQSRYTHFVRLNRKSYVVPFARERAEAILAAGVTFQLAMQERDEAKREALMVQVRRHQTDAEQATENLRNATDNSPEEAELKAEAEVAEALIERIRQGDHDAEVEALTRVQSEEKAWAEEQAAKAKSEAEAEAAAAKAEGA